jgi:hypothetical protein
MDNLAFLANSYRSALLVIVTVGLIAAADTVAVAKEKPAVGVIKGVVDDICGIVFFREKFFLRGMGGKVQTIRVNRQGKFKIKNLNPGIYKLMYTDEFSENDSLIAKDNIEVKANYATKINVIAIDTCEF